MRVKTLPYAVILGGLLLTATVGNALRQNPAGVKATIQRQTDKKGPTSDSTVVRASDPIVWLKLEWANGIAQETKLQILWCDASDKAIVTDDSTVPAGAKQMFYGIYLAGKPIAQQPGRYTVKVLEAGQKTPLCQTTFQLEPAVSDPNKPAFDADLCQSVNASSEPVGKSRTFFSDHKAVWLAVKPKGKVAQAGKIIPKIFDAKTNDLVLLGAPVEIKPDTARAGTGFFIAGKDWAKAGGSFVFKAYWEEDATPVASLPFKIKTGNRYALLVGIKDYLPAGPEGDLPGCDRDIDRMKDLLVTSFGVPESQVKTVRDLEATKANIEKGLLELADKAQPNDAVIFYYSGHGALTPDLNGDEEDGWDEAIVPNEPHPALIGTEADLSRFITDDRMAELLRRFKTKNVTVIFDSCHSGTAVRDGEAEPPAELSVSKFRKFDFSRSLIRRAQEAQSSHQKSERLQSSRRLIGLEGEKQAPPTGDGAEGMATGANFVFLASSRPWETSGCNGLGGYFTTQLTRALQSADGQSWEQLLPMVRENVAAIRPGQNPGVEGNIKRFPFSLETATNETPYVRPFVQIVGAFKSGEKKAQQEDNGAAGTHRALLEGYQSVYVEQRNALYDVYPQGDAQMTGKPTGRVRITGDRESVVLATPAGRPPIERMYSTADILSGSVHRGDRLVAVSIPLPSPRPRVGVMFDSKSADKDRLLKAGQTLFGELKRIGSVDLVEQFRFSDVDYVLEPKLRNGQMTGYIWSSGGWSVGSFGGTEAEIAAKMAQFLTQRHTQETRLVRIFNPSPSFRLTAEAEGGEKIYAPGETVKIKVDANSACYLIVCLITNGKTEGFQVLPDQLKPGSPTTLSFKVAPDYKGGVIPFKIIAVKELPDVKSFTTAPADGRVATFLKAMQAKFGVGEGGERFLSTEGWADATLRFAVEK